jgi:hypothetical protein
VLVHRKSAKFWPIKRFYSLPIARQAKRIPATYSANVKQRNPEGSKGRKKPETRRKGTRKQRPKKKNKKRFDPQSAKRFECFQAGKEASE